MNIQELKEKSSEKLITEAEKLGIENASTLRRQEIYFAILKKLAEKGEEITGGGVLQLLQDGFGFLRAMESNYFTTKSWENNDFTKYCKFYYSKSSRMLFNGITYR